MQFDVITIGGGFSGLVTACRASELGLKAAVLEARSEDRYPCSSRWSTGAFGVMGISLMNPPEILAAAILDGTGGTAKPELVHAVAQNARRAHDWLVQAGARFELRGALTQSQHMMAPPRRLDIGGLDWDGRGADLLMQRLEEKLRQGGGQVFRGTRAEALIVEHGACVGVTAGRERFDAKAVVVADGGFAANRAMIARYITPRADRVLTRVGPGAMGDEASSWPKAAGREQIGRLRRILWPYPSIKAKRRPARRCGPIRGATRCAMRRQHPRWAGRPALCRRGAGRRLSRQ